MLKLPIHFLRLAFMGALSLSAADPGPGNWIHEELRRFPAAEARQGVAVDAEFFYAINNRAIGKYRKDTGAKAADWQDEKDGHLIHLNAGIVRDGQLYCAHSNYPSVPTSNSVEVWDTATMKHILSIAMEDAQGSLTWALPEGKTWFACFAEYSRPSNATGRDNSMSEVVKFDNQWHRTASWTFPLDLVKLFGNASASGGGFGPGGSLFVTGHDARQLYVLTIPENGAVLQWNATIPISASGQAFAWDPVEPGILYSISRKTQEVIVSRITDKK